MTQQDMGLYMLLCIKSSASQRCPETGTLQRLFNLSMLIAAKKQPDNFDESFQAKAYLGRYLNEKC